MTCCQGLKPFARQNFLICPWIIPGMYFGNDMRKIFLYGPPGSGKTNVGKILAENLDARFIDIDADIVSEAGQSIAVIISNLGEAAFRKLESKMIERVCETRETEPSNSSCVIVALGGGALLFEDNRSRCERAGDIVFLEVDYASLVSRIAKEGGQRPLLAGDLEKNLVLLLEQRKDIIMWNVTVHIIKALNFA